MINNRLYNFSRAACLITALFIISCANFKAYFNTFYNAENYFEKAEKSRLENRGDALPKGAQEDYQKVIEKSQIILSEFPVMILQGTSVQLRNLATDSSTSACFVSCKSSVLIFIKNCQNPYFFPTGLCYSLLPQTPQITNTPLSTI